LKLVIPTALVLAAFLAAGCGNSAPSDGGYAAKVDAICASLAAADAKLSPTGGAAAVKARQALLTTALTKLGDVSAPYNHGEQYQAFLFELTQVDSVLPRLAAATAAHDATRIKSLEAQERGSERSAASSAVDAGLKGCS
jgi:hypothetical protein